MNQRRSSALVLIIVFLMVLLASASHGRTITTASPSWAGFTSPDSQGLYHDLIQAVFSPAGFSVRHVEVPAKRGMIMLHQIEADIYLGQPDPAEGIIISRLPLYEGQFHAAFLTTTVPDWTGVSSMADKRVVWRLGYYTPANFPVPIQLRETSTGVDAMQRLMQNGTDFYVDDRHLILESMRDAAINPEQSGVRIEPIGFRHYYPAFTDNRHDRELREIFEKGMTDLATRDKLRPLYTKWNLPMPRIYEK